MKIMLSVVYVLVVIIMAAATVFEKCYGTETIAHAVYGAWWFSAVWGVLTALAIAYIVQKRVRRPSVLLLHFSFVVILAGALVTHLTAWQGMLHLRMNAPDTSLPFAVTLKGFDVKYHKGTNAPYDYVSNIEIKDHGQTTAHTVSMNNIASHQGYRLYQNSYDDDMQGSTFSVNYDPWGIPITYAGYALLFFSLVWNLLDPKGTFRRCLNKTSGVVRLLMPFAFVVAFTSAPLTVSAQEQGHPKTTLDAHSAEAFGKMYIKYNERICPVETFALDFTKTLTGARSFEDYNATQVLAGFVLFSDEWMKRPVIKVKSTELRKALSLDEYSAPQAFFKNGYMLGPLVREYYQGSNDALHKAAADVDNKLMLIMQVRSQHILTVFPYAGGWYSPTDSLPQTIEPARKEYVRNAINILASLAKGGEDALTLEMIKKISAYQKRYGAEAIPSPLRTLAEHIYNAAPYTTILFIVCILCALITLPAALSKYRLWMLSLQFILLSAIMAIRWIIAGRIPMANGYETMITMAWMVQLSALVLYRRFNILATMAMLLSGFFLLASHLSQMNPEINHIMPVLQSPLLTIHVSLIMMSYAMLSITAACAMLALCKKNGIEEVTNLSLLMLYPAMACLGAGIFIGAIWANVSWGTYWSWDPKETWALITFMVYAVPMHRLSLPSFKQSNTYHAYMLLAFLSVIITYFGVNYLLGGMHSYA